jgi:hypothetical protein
MVLNATLNNSSVISLRSVLLVQETGVPGENHRPVGMSHVTYKLYHIMLNRAYLGAEFQTPKFSCDKHWLHK